MGRIRPPKPPSRPDHVGPVARLRLFRKDMFRSQPARLYRAWMARMRTPLGQSVLVNDPALVRTVLEDRYADFPKARAIAAALGPLLGRSVFVTNGPEWAAQRRIIDPAFAAGRLRETFPAMHDAAVAALGRLSRGTVEIEFEMSHFAADVIFRTLFSMPIGAPEARDVFEAFRAYQRSQPLLSPAGLLPLPGWLARPRGSREAARIRRLLAAIVDTRARAIEEGSAPDDLATKIMTGRDPDTGRGFTEAEMLDQVAIFFLAGHETSASALSWALYCLACDPDAQEAAAAEAATLPRTPAFGDLSRLAFVRDCFREALRLYPPVPMMVREATARETFRGHPLPPGALVILSPWHLHRHERLWPDPDLFDPWRWQRPEDRTCARDAYAPFSRGPRVCTGAGFAMMEGTLMLALMLRAFRLAPGGPAPVPVAHLTVRSEAGIHLSLEPRHATGVGGTGP